MKHLIQSLLFMLTLCLSASTLQAQTPQAFNYQGVARDASGTPIANRTIAVLFTISFRTPDDLWSSAYQERQVLTTTDFGLFSARIGLGESLTPWTPFANINWAEPGQYHLEMAIDMTGGTSYVSVGAPTRLLSVPYALHAATCDEVVGGLNWIENINNPGTIINSNENTVIITPGESCCYALLPDAVQPALIVDGLERPIGGSFKTNNISEEAAAIRAEISGNSGDFHTHATAIRARAVITSAEGPGGIGGEFVGGATGLYCEGQGGLIAVTTAENGLAGEFLGNVSISKNLSVNNQVSANSVLINGTQPRLTFEKIAGGVAQSFYFEGFNAESPKLVLNKSYISPGGAYLSPLMSVDDHGRMAVGSDNAGNFSMSVQQNDNLGFALTRDGTLSNTWEMYLTTSSTPDRQNLQLYAGNAYMGQFNPVTGAYSPFSDRKFKSDIRPLSTVIAEVKKLNLVSYQTKQDASGTRHNGVIAQELEQVFPEYVTVGQDRDGAEVRSVDYAGLSIVALKAIQEQEARLEKLEKANADLMARLQKLESKR